MPKQRPAIQLSPMRGGINRFEAEAQPDQTVDCLDVVNDDGDLRRRDAFRTIATAAPHVLPTSAPYVVMANTSDAARYTDSTQSYNTAHLASFGILYVGAPEPFDCVELWDVVFSGSLSTNSRRASVGYWNGSKFVSAPATHDETFLIPDGSAKGQCLSRNGRISWHRSSFTGWVSGSPAMGGSAAPAAAYWVAIWVVNSSSPTGALSAIGGTVSGQVRCGLLQPVNLLAPVRLRGNRVLLIGSDRTTPRGLESGGKLAAWPFRDGPADQLMIVGDEGAGVYGSLTWPQWQKGGANVGSAGLTSGTAALLTKWRQRYASNAVPASAGGFAGYSWGVNQFFGSPIIENLVVLAGSTATSIKTSTITSIPDHKYERLLLVFTSGALNAEVVEIQASTSSAGVVTITVADKGLGAPSAGDTFKITRAAWVKTSATGIKKFLIASATADTLGFLSAINATYNGSSNIIAAGITGRNIFWEIGRDIEWTLTAGYRYSFVYDTVSGQVIVTNGNGGLLTYDGRRLRPLAADTTSDYANLAYGLLPDRQGLSGGTDPTLTPASALATAPPAGRFIVESSGRLAVAGFKGRPYSVEYSLPGLHNNIWPRINTAILRDSKNDPITGLATLGQNLIAFTKTCIFAGGPADDYGIINFVPIAQGIGFVAHAAVARAAIKGVYGPVDALIGVTPDGVASITSGEPTFLIDRWSRVLDGGVNESRLQFAVAAVLVQRKQFFCAVAAQGASKNNRLICVDYGTGRIWPWSHPFGISSLATATDDAGREFLLIGTDDGHVQTLSHAPDDDGVAINAYAKSPPITPFGQNHGAMLRAFLVLQSMGRGQTVDVRFILDRSEVPFQTAQVAPAHGNATFGTTLFDSSTRYADDGFRTVQCQIKPGAKGVQVQYRLGGTAAWRLREASLEARQLGSRPR